MFCKFAYLKIYIMLTDLQLQEIKNTIPNIEIYSFDTYFTSNGLNQTYINEEHDLIFNNIHIVLDVFIAKYHTDIEVYNGITESNSKLIDKQIKIVNIAISDKEYDFTEQQENEIINSIKEITFKN